MATSRRGARMAFSFAILLVLLSLVSPLAEAAVAADVTFSVGESVSSQDEADVREAIRFAQDYFAETFDFDPPDSLAVNVRNNSHPAEPAIVAFAGGEYLVVYTGSFGWIDASPFDRLHVIVHEYVHVYQYERIGFGDDGSPAWLIEGTAEYFSYEAVIDRGLVRERSVRDYQAWAVADYEDDTDLASIESLRAFQKSEGPVYPLSYLAIQFLFEDREPADLDRYFRAIAAGTDWRSAFAEVFGVDVETFYRDFDEWREDLIAPRSMPKIFRTVEASDEPADVAIEELDETVALGEQTLIVAETDPAARCRLRLRSGTQPAAVSRPSVADATGLVFWLVTIPEELPTGPATVTIACGGPRETATIEIEAAA